jgi:hypothetical protein
MSEKTIYDVEVTVERAKFNGFGTCKLPIEERVNKIIEATKKEYPNMDNYLLWLCAVDYVIEEKGLKKDNDEGFKMYEEYIKQKKLFVYNNVRVVREDLKGHPTLAEEDDVIKPLFPLKSV